MEKDQKDTAANVCWKASVNPKNLSNNGYLDIGIPPKVIFNHHRSIKSECFDMRV
jgi:hypothetical protein